jgi:hypothetical protein
VSRRGTIIAQRKHGMRSPLNAPECQDHGRMMFNPVEQIWQCFACNETAEPLVDTGNPKRPKVVNPDGRVELIVDGSAKFYVRAPNTGVLIDITDVVIDYTPGKNNEIVVANFSEVVRL